jgi:hypothetical protein
MQRRLPISPRDRVSSWGGTSQREVQVEEIIQLEAPQVSAERTSLLRTQGISALCSCT